MERHIVHMDMDTFYVSVERLRNSSLIGKPILIGGSSDRGVVASCSYEARQFGVHSAMPMKLARQLCPDAILVRGDHDAYAKYSDMVTEIITERAPVVEKASVDEFYLDLTGMDRYFGCYTWTHELRQRITKETGLPISFGLSENKTVSKIATGQAKPNGELHITQGTEKSFLAPLSVRKIPMIGEKTYVKLRQLSITKVGIIQQMDVEVMESILGMNGVTIWRKANGLDDSPVIPYSKSISISHDETFERDTIDMVLLKQTITGMCDKLAFELRKQQRLTKCVTLKIRYSDFQTYTMQRKIPYTSSDKTLRETAMDLFLRLYTKRMLIRLVGVKFSDLVAGNYQIDLFNDAVTQVNLNRAMDSIKLRFGTDKILRASNL